MVGVGGATPQPTPLSSAPDDKFCPPDSIFVVICLLFSPRLPPSRLLVSSVVAPDPDDDDDDDDAVSAASTATTTAARGSLPLGLGDVLSLHHFTLLLVVVSAPPANAA